MNTKTEYISQLVRQHINSLDSKAEIILYGSRARGDQRIDSDWDILILTNDSVDINKERMFKDNLYDLELETGEPISIFVYSKKDWQSKQRITPFYENVVREGIRL